MNNGIRQAPNAPNALGPFGFPDKVPASPNGYPRGRAQWSDEWRRAWIRASRNGGQAHVACFGDSITQGYYTTGDYWANSYPGLLGNAINAVTRVTPGTGVIPIHEEGNPGDSRTSRTGSWNPVGQFGFYSQFVYAPAGGTFTLGPIDCDGFRIWYIKYGNATTWTYTVDGGSAVSVPSQASVSSLDVVEVDAGGFGSHTLVLSTAAVGMYVHAIEAVRNSKSGVRVSRVAHASKRTDELLSTTEIVSSKYCMEQIRPDLSLIGFGVNEVSQGYSLDSFRANTRTLITSLRNIGSSVVVVVPPPPNPASVTGVWSDYVAVLRECASELRTGIVDITAAWGTRAANTSYYQDNLHPNLAGFTAMSALIAPYILAPVA